MSSEEEYEYTGLRPGALVKIEGGDGFSGPHIIVGRSGNYGQWFNLVDQATGQQKEVFVDYVWRLRPIEETSSKT